MLLDIHTHHPAPQPEGIINASPTDFTPVGSQFYSVGYHPWDTQKLLSEDRIRLLRDTVSLPCVAAVGECGVDPNRGGPMFIQLQNFRTHIEISETVGKPLIIHAVKSPDIVIGLRRDLDAKQLWILHGFRGKPQIADMYLKAGIALSYGEKFNAEALRITPPGMLYAETDDSPLSIREIIAALSAAAGKDLTPDILQNTSYFPSSLITLTS